MTEAQAWRVIARRFDAGKESYSGEGLCCEAWELASYGLMSSNDVMGMVVRCRQHVLVSPFATNQGGATYAYPPGTHREERVLAALWLALEAEDETESDFRGSQRRQQP